jgi:signal transduction histidine kinase
LIRGSTLAAIREFASRIDDHELPEVHERLHWAARVASLVNAVTIPFATATALFGGLLYPERGTLWILAQTLVFGSFYALSRTRLAERTPEIVLFGMAVAVGAAVSFSPLVQRDPTNYASGICLVEPIVIAAFAPWRPTWSMALVPLLYAISSAALIALTHGPVAPEHLYTNACVVTSCGVAAAVANQMHRRWWLRFEQARASLVAAERMSGAAMLTAGIAHEIKTPLAAAMNSLHLATSLCDELGRSIGHADVGDDDLRAIGTELAGAVATASSVTARAGAYVAAIREKTRIREARSLQEIEVLASVRAVESLLGSRIHASRVQLAVEVPAGLRVNVDPLNFEQILTNLLTNALEACDESAKGTRVVVSAVRLHGGVRIAVSDDGPGIPASIRGRIFDAMFTTRAAGSGTGLGLAIARDIAVSSGGGLVLVEAAVGARFELTLPIAGQNGPPSRSDFRPGFASRTG